MLTYPMPVGFPTFIEGRESEIIKILNNNSKFSFIEVSVECPSTVQAPILLHKFNGKVIAPVGSWTNVYTSTEINRALELGYTFKYHRAVYFQSKIIFKEYVDFYYDMKKNSNKNSSTYEISKLMLNSIYGRFGMSPYLNKSVISFSGLSAQLLDTNIITDILPLNDDKELITYYGNEEDEFEDRNSMSNVAIASAITAGARAYMSYFKNNSDFTLYYSDTDSIYIDGLLPSKYVGKEIGQFKLEDVFDEAVFLSPKVYGGITSDYEIVRVKGLKMPVKFTELKSLLKKGSSLSKSNPKWYKDLSKGYILIKDEIYTLSITDSKRQLIFDTNNTFVDTQPIHINEIKKL